MIISAIDFSMNGPAVCVFDTQKEFNFKNCNFYFLTDTKKYATTFMNNIYGELFQPYDEDCERYDSISDWVMRVSAGSDQVALEGYAYNATGRIFHIAENTGILKYKLYQASLPVEIVEPTRVKKFATQKGNADKDMMYKFFVQETGVDLQEIITPNKTLLGSPVTDIVDAFFICMYFNDLLKKS
jgi:Holliday junction resolvasome RuvABC endonuclease subunit